MPTHIYITPVKVRVLKQREGFKNTATKWSLLTDTGKNEQERVLHIQYMRIFTKTT